MNKIYYLITFCFSFCLSFAQGLVIDSSFGTNGTSEILPPSFEYYSKMELSQGKDILICNSKKDILFLDSTGLRKDLNPFTNPISFSLNSKYHNEIFLFDILENNNALVAYFEFKGGPNDIFARKLNLNNLSDTSFNGINKINLSNDPQLLYDNGFRFSNIDDKELKLLLIGKTEVSPNYFYKLVSFNQDGIMRTDTFLDPIDCVDIAFSSFQPGLTNIIEDDGKNKYFMRTLLCDSFTLGKNNTIIKLDSNYVVDLNYSISVTAALSKYYTDDMANHTLIKGSNNDLFVIIYSNYKTNIIKINYDGQVDSHFGNNGIINIDGYRTISYYNTNSVFFDKKENAIMMFIQNQDRTKSKLFAITRDGQLKPSYEGSASIFVEGTAVDFIPYDDNSYLVLSYYIENNKFKNVITKLKRNKINTAIYDNPSSNHRLVYDATQGIAHIYNDHSINKIEVFDILGHTVTCDINHLTESHSSIKFNQTNHGLNIIRIHDNHGHSYVHKLLR